MKDWNLAQELFELTAGLPAPQRERLLQERSQGDQDLVRRVEELAAADANPHGGFDKNAAALLLELRAEPAPELLSGLEFDNYKIEAYLSSGGMAHVYRATRTSAGTERRVALKVLRPGLDTRAFLERFQRERETLAGLEHEHIVSFLDAAAMPDGRPSLVMEYVEGLPLSKWNPGASVRRKLELFLQVLSAVQYAHERLIVHRDLKPSNVLVTAQGIPKLLDFGVAQVLGSEAKQGAGRGPITPAYASPEVLAGLPATTMSDVFSLGVLLHEFLSGRLPAEGRAPALGGDLDAILCRAMAPNPELRYRSAEQLGRDLERHLAGEPVSARHASWTYSSGLYLRRHRYGLLLAGSIILASVVGWIGSDLERRSAEREASVGWGAHAQARYVSRVFELWMAKVTSLDSALSSNAEAYLEQALSGELVRLPEAETLVRLTLARLYYERGEIERSAQHAERAWTLAQDTRGLGDEDRDRATKLRDRIRAAL